MPLFPSREWMDEYCVRLASHPRAGEVAEALDGVYRFVVEPAGPLPDRHAYDVEIRPADAAAAVTLLDGAASAPRLTMAADYRRWRQLILGELDVRLALVLGRLRISGDLSAVAGRLSSSGPLTSALREVDSEWLDG